MARKRSAMKRSCFSSGLGCAESSKNLRNDWASQLYGKPKRSNKSHTSMGSICMGVAVSRIRPCVLALSPRMRRNNRLGWLEELSREALRRAWWASSNTIKSHGAASSSSCLARSGRRIRSLEARSNASLCHSCSATNRV